MYIFTGCTQIGIGIELTGVVHIKIEYVSHATSLANVQVSLRYTHMFVCRHRCLSNDTKRQQEERQYCVQQEKAGATIKYKSKQQQQQQIRAIVKSKQQQ